MWRIRGIQGPARAVVTAGLISKASGAAATSFKLLFVSAFTLLLTVPLQLDYDYIRSLENKSIM
jgi:hypothetical protein